MPASKDSPPDNVIALSRYRAQLGRGKRLRRSEALMASPNPEAAIRALPGDELYYIVHEAGHARRARHPGARHARASCRW